MIANLEYEKGNMNVGSVKNGVHEVAQHIEWEKWGDHDLEKALAIASFAHAGVWDKNSVPYILHPLTVMSFVSGDDEKIVAVLHDVVEDTDLTLDDLKEFGFDDVIVDAVDAVTKRKGEDYFDYIARVKENPIAIEVKLADLKHNSDPSRFTWDDPKKWYDNNVKYAEAQNILLSRKRHNSYGN